MSPEDVLLYKEIEKRGLGLAGKRTSETALSFRRFIKNVEPKYVMHRHCELLTDVGQRIVDGKLHRVICMMPFRHSKSKTMTELLGAYHEYRYPERWTGLVSYSAMLANDLSNKAQGYYRSAGGPVSPTASSKQHWETGRGGGMWAAGMEGSIIGKGFHLGIIDDPLKDQAEAMSETIRSARWDWFQSVFMGREQVDHSDPNSRGAILITMTRWHEQDLVGKLITLAKEAENNPDVEPDDRPVPWHVVCLPAVAEELWERDFPSNWTIEKDWREPGEALCPAIRSAKNLKRMKASIGSHFWATQWQQRPTVAGGEKFIADRFRYWKKAVRADLGDVMALERPDQATEYVSLNKCQIFATVDTASSEKTDADFSCILVFAVTPSKDMILLHRVHGRFADGAFMYQAKALRERFSLKGTPIAAFYVEKNGPGIKVAQNFTAAGIPTIPTQTVADKVARASTAIVRIETNQVFFPLGEPWLADFERELLGFPRGSHDDQVDCLSLAAEKTFGPSLISVLTDSANASRTEEDRVEDKTNDFARPIPERFQNSPFRHHKSVDRVLFGERN